jgi:hypothetical protein
VHRARLRQCLVTDAQHPPLDLGQSRSGAGCHNLQRQLDWIYLEARLTLLSTQ